MAITSTKHHVGRSLLNPVDVVKMIDDSQISDKGKELLKQAIGG